jgi:hypothetical protein
MYAIVFEKGIIFFSEKELQNIMLKIYHLSDRL